MNIALPKKAIYTEKDLKNYGYISRGRLYIKGYINYESLMYNISYALKGYDTCYYCGKRLGGKSRTLDHKYPQAWGGISITDNLEPTCKECNNKKTNMTEEQFLEWRNLSSKEEKEKYYCKCVRENETMMRIRGYLLPEEWVCMYNVRELMKYYPFQKVKGEKYKMTLKYYERFGCFPHPIIVSSNNWILKGSTILKFAKEHNLTSLPAVVLNNVSVIKYSP